MNQVRVRLPLIDRNQSARRDALDIVVPVRVCDAESNRLHAYFRLDIVCEPGRGHDDVAPLGEDRLILADLPLCSTIEGYPPFVEVGVDVWIGRGSGRRRYSYCQIAPVVDQPFGPALAIAVPSHNFTALGKTQVHWCFHYRR